MEQTPEILFSDNHILVVRKPAGMTSQPEHSGAQSLLCWCKEWIRREKGKKEGNVFCGLVHRLDRNVSGVMVYARTSKAASRLSEAWREKRVLKEYLALASPKPAFKSETTLIHFLERNDRTRKTTVHSASGPHTKEAETRVCTWAESSDTALLHLQPITGRPHQLRAQLAYVGSPLLGDYKYGSKRLEVGLALHGYVLEFPHPTLRKRLRVTVPPPLAWKGHLALPAHVADAVRLEWEENE